MRDPGSTVLIDPLYRIVIYPRNLPETDKWAIEYTYKAIHVMPMKTIDTPPTYHTHHVFIDDQLIRSIYRPLTPTLCS